MNHNEPKDHVIANQALLNLLSIKLIVDFYIFIRF